MKAAIDAFKKIVIENFSRKDFQYHEWMGIYHLEVVEKIALELCDVYSNADRDLVQALVWFHDFGKPIDEENERKVTLEEGPKVMQTCGFPQVFIEKVVECWQLMEKKNEIDIRTTPIETQIVSTADGCSHLVGVFYPSYFGDGYDFITTQKRIGEKMKKDWERKIVLPEAQRAFQDRYIKAKEMLGEFPDTFL